jgi:hypothetical protein
MALEHNPEAIIKTTSSLFSPRLTGRRISVTQGSTRKRDKSLLMKEGLMNPKTLQEVNDKVPELDIGVHDINTMSETYNSIFSKDAEKKVYLKPSGIYAEVPANKEVKVADIVK